MSSGLYGRARAKREDFAKSARRDIIDSFISKCTFE